LYIENEGHHSTQIIDFYRYGVMVVTL
jgi:hypothetical protein